MQPYVNPNYFNQYPQYQNPYFDRLQNLQQFQQAMHQPQFVPMGKVVESLEMVKSIDIPMDGNSYYFPKADGTEIYSKRWLANGTTETIAYKPVLDTFNASGIESTNEGLKIDSAAFGAFTEVLDKRFADLKEQIDGIAKAIKPVKTKKEAE